MSTSYKHKSTGGKDSAPKFSWGGLITFLAIVLVIGGMIIYQTYFKQ